MEAENRDTSERRQLLEGVDRLASDRADCAERDRVLDDMDAVGCAWPDD